MIEYVSHAEPCGYGEAARRLILALRAQGTPIRWTPICFHPRHPVVSRECLTGFPDLEPLRDTPGRPDVVVVHAIPELLPALRALRPRAAALVAATVWEADRIQAHWRDLLDCDAVIVPTEWNAASFRAGGVRAPIHVVPHAAAVDQPEPGWLGAGGLDLGDGFLVHSIAAWSARKAPWRTVEAFARAFAADEATLVLRTDERIDPTLDPPPGPDGRRWSSSWWVAHVLHAHGPTGRVHLVYDVRTPGELAALHRRSQCWLSLPHGEGWDLGAFDAACAGTPVVTTAFGGPLEYLGDGGAHLIPGRRSSVPGVPGASWLQPDIPRAVAALRAIRSDPAAAREAAADVASRLRTSCAPVAVAQRFLAAVGGG